MTMMTTNKTKKSSFRLIWNHYFMLILSLLTFVHKYLPLVEGKICTIGNKSIECFHESNCALGDADFSEFPEAFFLEKKSENGLHCECNQNPNLPKHTSYNCNHKYEVCDDFTYCFHGGSCVHVNGTEDFICDCSTTTRGNSRWVGDHCEVRATEECGDDDNLDSIGWLCANNGICKPNENDVDKKCECPDGFKGPHCEYKADHDIPECDLECFNGGKCKLGTKDFGIVDADVITANNQKDGMHCVCGNGFTGLQCETYMSECGDSYCLNGAQCIIGRHNSFCNCKSITSDVPVAFSGKHCEYPSSAICPTLDHFDPLSMFCVNGGKCREKDEAHKGCKCSPEFTGHRCEFKKEKKPTPCNLKCRNGGVCRNGLADFGISDSDFELPQLKEKHIDFMHCTCPKGFTGVLCEIELEICGDKDFVCAFGSKCKKEGTDKNGKEKYGCDCDPAHTILTSYAGKMCEYDSTSFCAKGDGTPGESSHSFCTNGGKCLNIISPEYSHQGCMCPDNFTGDFCEFKTEFAVKAPKSGSDRKSPTGVILTFLAFFLASVVLALYIVKKRQDLSDSKEVTSMPIQNDVTASKETDIGTEHQRSIEKPYEDDGEMKDIELI